MLCDKYKSALVEAAASGAALHNTVRGHVKACQHCAAVLAGERNIFATVDAGLYNAANAKVRSSFVSELRAKLPTETVPFRSRITAWALVCATGALAMASFFLSLPRNARDKNHTEAINAPSKVVGGGGSAVLNFAPDRQTRYDAKASKVPGRLDVATATSHELEVLIQPEEEEYLKRFYAAVRSPVGEARVVVTDNHELTTKPLAIKQIEVRELKIENLDQGSGIAQAGTK